MELVIGTKKNVFLKTSQMHPVLWHRLKKYNNQIETARRQVTNSLLTTEQRNVTCDVNKQRVADAYSPSYFDVIKKATQVITITLDDNIDNVRKYLRTTYYHYASNDCILLEKESKGGQYYGLRYGAECRGNITQIEKGHELSDVALGEGIPDKNKAQEDGRYVLTFIHIIPNAISYDDGNVFHDNMKIVPQKCQRQLKKYCSKRWGSVKRYREVFTIAQFWGDGFYHGTLEELPRISPYLLFLQRHPEIKIHVKGTPKFLTLLGINKSRLIHAPAIKADILYMPAGGSCGRSSLFTTQLLASVLATKPIDVSLTSQDTIVLIKRTKLRWFGHHQAILEMMEKHASRVNLSVQVFSDNPLPSLEKTIEMFRRALIVVAPHGAGESNLIFSQPGTLLIEGLCYDSDRKANLCYRNMAQALGLRYYGLIYRYQCMKITDKQVEKPLLEYLNLKYNYQPS